jgi:L-lactate dehydrogenase complex protein LldE
MCASGHCILAVWDTRGKEKFPLVAPLAILYLRAMRVGLFIPCFVDQLFPRAGIAMVEVLRRLKIDVDYPAAQTCCGQPAFNTGYWDEARQLARRYREIFAGSDAVVCPSGSCTAMVRNFYPELGVQPPATYEFAEFLVKQLGVTDVGATFPAKVTYHDACHALRELRLKDEPRQLLRHVRGLELIEMTEAETCCGFGGTFSVKFPPISQAMDEVKCASIAATGADYVVSTDSSCLMHIAARLRPPLKTIHLAEVLASQ